MKLYYLMTLLLLGLFIASCSKDEPGDCVQDDFIGTYAVEGNSCLFKETNVILIITFHDDGVAAEFHTSTGLLAFDDAFILNGCKAQNRVVNETTVTDYTMTLRLDGDILKVSASGSLNGGQFSCSDDFKR